MGVGMKMTGSAETDASVNIQSAPVEKIYGALARPSGAAVAPVLGGIPRCLHLSAIMALLSI